MTKSKWIVFIVMSAIAIACIAFAVFFCPSGDCDYSNIQPIGDSGVSVVYAGKDRKSKICVVKYYDSARLEEFTKSLEEDDVIYIPQNTPIEKEFFEELNSATNYRITFLETGFKIEITKKGIQNQEN